MSHIGNVEAGQGGQAAQTERCLTPTMIKVGALVAGVLLVGAGVAMYLLGVNAIASYVTAGLGGAIVLGIVIWSVVDCLRGNGEGKEHTLDLSQVAGNPRISAEEVAQLLRDNPNLKKLKILLRPHVLDNNWDPDFKAVETYFKFNAGASSGSWYIFDRTH